MVLIMHQLQGMMVKQEQAEMTMRKVMVLSSVRVHFHLTQQP
jgi:hypothetical protein